MILRICATFFAAVMAAGTGNSALALPAAQPANPIANATNILPAMLTPAEQQAYKAIFAAIRSNEWAAAGDRLSAMPTSVLHATARAEILIGKGLTKANPAEINALLTQAPESPMAQQLARTVRARGVELAVSLPMIRDLARIAGPSVRRSARAKRNEAAATALAAQVLPLIKDNRPSDAEMLLAARSTDLSPEAYTEWQQRIAWSYYLTGDDAAALRMASDARNGNGEWAVQADWVAGLAAWRTRNCTTATASFDQVAIRATDPEMIAAGNFWASRTHMMCARPDKVQPRLRAAARYDETFYGLLAQGALGLTSGNSQRLPGFGASDWQALGPLPNIRVATALVEIGENALADQYIRHQARIGETNQHPALLRLAGKLALPATQIWLARNGPAGAAALSASARYPAPAWTPGSGWQVDRSLVYAHALQESQFRSDAVSPAGARGLMQLMPATAQLVARREGRSIDAATLNQPVANIELGQKYLRMLADNSGTGGLLPKVIAAYNAGPNAVANWNARGRNLADPLLFIESIPYAETRGYVAIVLRNYWMYQRQSGAKTESLLAIAQGMWPRFPGLPGRTALRLSPLGATASAD